MKDSMAAGGHIYFTPRTWSRLLVMAAFVITALSAQAELPSAVTGSVDSILGTKAVLHGTVTPHGSDVSVYFQYSANPALNVPLTTLFGSTFGPSPVPSLSSALPSSSDSIAVDSRGFVYVNRAGGINRISPTNQTVFLAGGFGGLLMDMTLDSANNLYVTDWNLQCIWKITPTGVVSVFAGVLGQAGYTNGPATTAKFAYPQGITCDSADNIYVSERFGQRIRKITPAGIVSTLAGTGAVGSADGPGTTATFNYPYSLTIDSSNNIYVADPHNHKIRKITPAGVVSTYAGSGTDGTTDGAAATATFHSPFGITCDKASGNIFAADKDLYTPSIIRIRKITPTGLVSTVSYPAAQPPNSQQLTSMACDNAGILMGVGGFSLRTVQGTWFTALAGLNGEYPVSASLQITRLAPNTTYYYRTVALGPEGITTGAINSFTTTDLLPPTLYYATGLWLFKNIPMSPISPLNTGDTAASYSISPTTLPAGLAFSTSTGVLSGTPTEGSPPTDYVVTATNAAGASSATVTIRVYANSLAQFRESYGLAYDGSQDLLTPAGDGVSNLLKYAFNMASEAVPLTLPNSSVITTSGSSGLPLIQLDGSNHLTLTFVRRKTATNPGVSYVPEVSSDLSPSWTTITVTPVVTSIDTTWERVTYTDTETVGSTGKRFLRVRVVPQ